MKTWNAPVLSELNINATANGWWDAEIETCVLWNDSKKQTPDPVDPVNEPS